MLKKKPRASAPYMPKIMEQMDGRNINAAYQTIQDAAIDYFNRLNGAMAPIPAQDGAIVIRLLNHMAAEMKRHDPVAARLADTISALELPPINYTKK